MQGGVSRRALMQSRGRLPIFLRMRTQRALLACCAMAALNACGDIIAVDLVNDIACAPIAVGDSVQVIAQTLRDGWPAVAYTSSERATEFDWHSSAPQVATVSRRGVLVARSPGQTTVWVLAEGFLDSATVDVLAPRTEVTLTPSSLLLQVGDSVAVTVRAVDATGEVLQLGHPSTTVRFWGPWDHRAAVEVWPGRDGATVVGVRRGMAPVSWAVAGRCGMMMAEVR